MLAGIAAGSYLVAPWLRRRPERDWLLALQVIEGGIAIASLLSFGVLPRIPGLVATAGPAVGWFIGDYLAYLSLVSFAVIMPTMLLFGAAFPIGLHAWARRRQDDHPRRVTRRAVLLAERGGGDRGLARRGLPVIPVFGSLETLAVLAALALCPRSCSWPRRGRRRSFAWLPALRCARCFSRPPGVRRTPSMRISPSGTPTRRSSGGAKRSRRPSACTRTRRGSLTLHVSGNHQAGAGPHSPITDRQPADAGASDAREALVIGLGGGATAGALSQHTGVSVDVVELSPKWRRPRRDSFVRSTSTSCASRTCGCTMMTAATICC